ncbi:adenylosuccinate synthetase isozyme 1 [Platysternon megacephalum]|uniref:Adenylosuccinate synthetase isozyme 1 n=1 Tax=Platysternon megacephalum TaxID=55544 RepID=A0A4D9F6I2_9SAUR|nr:adenylosuccinate synthetase isozyme 1 [Platysternon megacephalum]
MGEKMKLSPTFSPLRIKNWKLYNKGRMEENSIHPFVTPLLFFTIPILSKSSCCPLSVSSTVLNSHQLIASLPGISHESPAHPTFPNSLQPKPHLNRSTFPFKPQTPDPRLPFIYPGRPSTPTHTPS